MLDGTASTGDDFSHPVRRAIGPIAGAVAHVPNCVAISSSTALNEPQTRPAPDGVGEGRNPNRDKSQHASDHRSTPVRHPLSGSGGPSHRPRVETRLPATSSRRRSEGRAIAQQRSRLSAKNVIRSSPKRIELNANVGWLASWARNDTLFSTQVTVADGDSAWAVGFG